MNVKLAYGRQGLNIQLPTDWNATIVEPRYVPGLVDPTDAIRQALREQNLRQTLLSVIQRDGQRVGVVFSDITRPTPNHIILPAILDELDAYGIPQESITLFNALGTHRPNTDAELRAMLGAAIVDRYHIVQNDAFDPATQVSLGTTQRGNAIWLNREFVACDFKLLTGFIEPHFFAGFSGGGKAVMPGMAGQRTVLGNHSAQMIGNSQATWGITWGNPIWEEAREVALKASNNVSALFLLNVTLNKDKQITGVFAGSLDDAHTRGCAFVRQTAMQPVPNSFDIVITTNSGYPLDLNLYQTVKGMCAAAQVVNPRRCDHRRIRVFRRHPGTRSVWPPVT